MNPTDKASIPKQVMARQVGEDTVILDLAGGTYYGLDPVGARIWQMMGEGKSLEEICDTLLVEYDVTREVLLRDVLELTDKLHSQKLISIE
jgi:hypothetical protein